MRRLIFVSFILSFTAAAQQPLYSHYKWFKVEDGLPQSFVSALVQDKDGFLWIGTRDGLARYDGREFRVFRSNTGDSLSLSANVITDLFLDAQNLLWVFYINERVDCFDPQSMKVCFRDSFSVVRKLLADLRIKKFTRDKAGRFWFNSSYKGVVSYDPLQNKTNWFDSLHGNLRSNRNLGLAEDAHGTIYAFTDKGAEVLHSATNRSSSFVAFNPGLNFKFTHGTFNHCVALPDGRLVLSETNRLIVFDPVNKIFTSHRLPANIPPEPNIIQHLQVAKDGLLYLVAAGAVYRFEKNNQFTWIWQSKSPNPFANDAKSFLIDQSMVMWFGTNAAGMYKVNLLSMPFSSSAYSINFTCDVLSMLTGSVLQLPATLQDGKWAYGLRFCYDRNNTLWLTQKRNESDLGPLAVYKLAGNKLQMLPAPADIFPVIRGLSTDQSGIIYGIDLRGNIWKWENDHLPPVMTPSVLHLPNTVSIIDMAADNGIFWVATDKNGLYKIENNKLSGHFTTGQKLQPVAWPTNQLTSLCKDPQNKDILWIGTLGYGLIRLNKSTAAIRVYTTENNLPNNTIYSIVPDVGGNLWISTNKGISRFSSDRSHFYNFDIKDGLVSNEFNRFHHLLLPDGRMAFGGPDGFSVFNPAHFVLDSFATPIALTRLLINNKPSGLGENEERLAAPLNHLRQLILPHNKNFLQFEFAGLEFNQPENIRYRYMLKGYDKEWIETGNRNMASYTKLPPGRYNLLLNATNSSGLWSPEVKQLAIHIKPPFWVTWWAYLFYALVLLLLLRTYLRYRTRQLKLQTEIALEHKKAEQLKEVDEIKTRFFSNITHELRTPLTLILTPLEKMVKEKKYSPVDMQVLAGAHRNAAQLLRLINQLLDLSKLEAGQMKLQLKTGELAAFIENCLQHFTFQAQEKNIRLDYVNDAVTGSYSFDEEKLEKVLFNLLSNAIKFTGQDGIIRVSLEQVAGLIRLTVTDSGEGIAANELPRIFDRFYMADDSSTRRHSGTGIGLSLVKELVELMGGQIHAASEPGSGSSFIVDLPLKKSIPVESVSSFSTAATAPLTAINSATNSVAEQESEKKLVLLAEDNEELRQFIVQGLSEKWRVISAANGKKGWELAVQEMPDIIISDVMMPEMDGFSLCQKVKDDPRTGHIAVILLTAKTAQESRLTGLQKGADEYLTKPFHFDELELRLQNLVKLQDRLKQHLRQELLPPAPLITQPHVNDIFIQELYKHLDAMLTQPDFSVDLLAQKVAMSQRTLNRKLKAILNITPVEFIRRYRLQKATLMLSSGHSISDAAYSVGFDTASYFTQCFKDEFGKTPTEFLSQQTA